MEAVSGGSVEIIQRILLEGDKSISKSVRSYKSKSGSKKTVKSILDVQNSSGETALHLASKQGKAQMVKLLLKAGAFTDLRDKDNNRPIDYSRQHPDDRTYQDITIMLENTKAMCQCRIV